MALHTTRVWQNGGRSAKLSICTSINISANLNICTSNPPLRQAPKRYRQVYYDTATLTQTTINWTLTQRQTILTVDQHTDHNSSGQRVSRHSLPTLCFLFFSHPHFLKTILSQPVSGTFGFAPTHKANPSQSQKSHFFAFAQGLTIRMNKLAIWF